MARIAACVSNAISFISCDGAIVRCMRMAHIILDRGTMRRQNDLLRARCGAVARRRVLGDRGHERRTATAVSLSRLDSRSHPGFAGMTKLADLPTVAEVAEARTGPILKGPSRLETQIAERPLTVIDERAFRKTVRDRDQHH